MNNKGDHMNNLHIKNILKLKSLLKESNKINSLSLLSFTNLLYYFIQSKYPDKKDSYI